MMVFRDFCSPDLDLDPMTLIYEFDLKILILHIKNELFWPELSKVSASQTDGQTYTQTRPKALPGN